MTIIEKISEYEKKANDKAIASKILDKMDGLRLENDDNSSKRWIWELLQNAKDCAAKEQKIKVNINFNKTLKIVEFSHNGQPFTLESITFLIKQVSTKERSELNNEVLTTGKFGTGFLSTHLLSEIVELESVVLYENTYKKFQITLDRSGRNMASVLNAIEKSFKQISQIDMNSPMKTFNQTAFNTKFTYKLNERGLVIAEQGLGDFKVSIFYVLIFIKNIYSVRLEHENREYILSEEVIQLSKNIQKYSITEVSSNAKQIYEVVVVSNDNVYIAMPIISVNNNIVFDATNKKSAKLFCDFPLVGTENFPFPAIINCSNFNPTEPRDGIFLTDIEDEKISENKSIIKKAYYLLYELIDFASFNNWGKMFALAQFSKTFEAKWVDSNWLNTELTDQLIDKLFTTPIVDTIDKKRKSVINTDNKFNVWFPSNDKPEVREMIWWLYSKYIPEILPLKEEIHEWYNSIIKNKTTLTVKDAFKNISSDGSIEQLNLRNNLYVFKWLNYFYKIVETNKDESIINNDEYKVLPNQNGVFVNKTNLRIDADIEDKIKDVTILLGIDVRENLLHKEVKYPINLKFENLTQSEVVDDINNSLKHNLRIDKLESCKLLIALFPNNESETKKRKKLYDFYLKIDKSFEQIEQTVITNWTEEIWEEADKIIVEQIVERISELQNVQALANEITNGNMQNALNWLNSVIEFLVKNEFTLINSRTISFLPNQNGYFCIREDLCLDNGEIDEVLKDICSELGYDFRDELLDKAIFLEMSDKNEVNEQDVVNKIIELVQPYLNSQDKSEETKAIFRKIVLWFHSNKDKARKLFGEYYRNKHKFYDDNEVAENMSKWEKAKEIFTEYNIKNFTELKKILESKVDINTIGSPKKETITIEDLISYGISSEKELEYALQDKNFSELFIHYSIPTSEMFLFAQSLIQRAKENIKKYLKTLKNYDCSEMEDTAPTVIAGIKKNGVPVTIVVRPSDFGEVIIYYSSEKDTLDYENAELWIEDGKNKPRHLTLGKILKTTGINRIPVYNEDN